MKKLIAAAVAAAVIAPASVMAAGPVLYGKINMSINHLDNGTDSETSLNSNYSRIGVKGSEDLGNGMKVGYLMEWAVDMDGDLSSVGGGDLTMRNRAITLSGDWGTVLAGNWDTPMKSVRYKAELFDSRVGDTGNLIGGYTTTSARTANTIAYSTPNMNGFSSTIAYVMDVRKAVVDDTDGDAISMNGIYNNGPLVVALGYENISDDAFGANKENQRAWRLAGSYAFGDFKVVGSFTDVSDANGLDNIDYDIWTLGAAYKMGNNTILFQYGDRDDSGNNADDGADQWAIGLEHTLSKRTMVFVDYSALDNDDNSVSRSWSGVGNNMKAVAGEDTDGFGVGIIHKF